MINAKKADLILLNMLMKMHKFDLFFLYYKYMSYLEYIIANKRDNSYNDILVDIYYSYYGIKPTKNQKIICIDGHMFNFSKHNLKIIDIIP